MTGKAAGSRSIWLRPVPEVRNGPPLTRQRITEAAVDLLDAEGMDRLTMRRLAERLGVGATTLYWHVETKDDVIDLAIDSIFGERPSGDDEPERWRTDIVALLESWRSTLLLHPWSAHLTASRRPLIGPNFLAWMEFLQATLARAGLAADQVAAATWVLFSHVQGSASSQSNLRASSGELAQGYEQVREQAGRYPTLSGQRYMQDNDWDANFRRGLDYILDGIDLQLRRQQ
ncbi:TetR/AcrR family transcriptional regulator [Nocardia takedensis]